MTHNWQVSNHQDGVVGRAGDPPTGPGEPGAIPELAGYGDAVVPPTGPGGPGAIPELAGYGDAAVSPPRTGRPVDDGATGAAGRPGGEDGGPVTDDHRNRFGLLLDRAAESGLLTSYEYEVRLRELASATTIEEMKRIVTELPAFTGRLPTAGTAGPPGLKERRKRRTNAWLVLVLVVVLVVSMVIVYLYAQHLTRLHNGGLWVPPGPGVSALRP